MSEKLTPVQPAKMCYSHIVGKPGQLLAETFADKGWIAKKASYDNNSTLIN